MRAGQRAPASLLLSHRRRCHRDPAPWLCEVEGNTFGAGQGLESMPDYLPAVGAATPSEGATS